MTGKPWVKIKSSKTSSSQSSASTPATPITGKMLVDKGVEQQITGKLLVSDDTSKKQSDSSSTITGKMLVSEEKREITAKMRVEDAEKLYPQITAKVLVVEE